jgi:hypothetical protein
MNWDGNKIIEHFIGIYERKNPDRYDYKPKHEVFDGLRDIELALQDFYGICAQSAWTKDRLLNALENVISSSIPNSKAINSEKYLTTLINEASNLKESINDGTFSI